MKLPILLFPTLCFDTKSARRAPGARPADQETESSGTGSLRCRSCRLVITDESQRISIGGDHTHTRSNPHGITFCFGCFEVAPGCTAVGGATDEHSWFAGCRWRIAICAGCGDHLGWLFTGTGRFFGLILDRLVAEAGGEK